MYSEHTYKFKNWQIVGGKKSQLGSDAHKSVEPNFVNAMYFMPTSQDADEADHEMSAPLQTDIFRPNTKINDAQNNYQPLRRTQTICSENLLIHVHEKQNGKSLKIIWSIREDVGKAVFVYCEYRKLSTNDLLIFNE